MVAAAIEHGVLAPPAGPVGAGVTPEVEPFSPLAVPCPEPAPLQARSPAEKAKKRSVCTANERFMGHLPTSTRVARAPMRASAADGA